jgi:hypothetical protein
VDSTGFVRLTLTDCEAVGCEGLLLLNILFAEPLLYRQISLSDPICYRMTTRLSWWRLHRGPLREDNRGLVRTAGGICVDKQALDP